jgi:hypothetical protein
VSRVRPALGRAAAAAVLTGRDVARLAAELARPRRASPPTSAVDAAVSWLCLTHDVTGRRGSSKGFSLVRGWLPAYPETTGYVVGTLLEYARRDTGRDELVARAQEMGRWEREVQASDGGVMEGTIGTGPRCSIVFNTGMVLHGWIDLEEAGLDGHEDAAARAVDFLRLNLRPDGTWRESVEYAGVPHTYNARVAWAMMRWGRSAGDDAVVEAAGRQLDWAVSRQRPNGWFEDCVFKPGTRPSTHGIAYTLRGLLESYALGGEDRWLHAVERTSEVLIRKLELQPLLFAAYEPDWAPAARYGCLTGTAQLGGVWLRLYQVTGDPRWLNAGLKAVEQAAAHQERGGWAAIRGALPGSFPLVGRYAPLQYPNWATKFLADSLMLYEDCLRAWSP